MRASEASEAHAGDGRYQAFSGDTSVVHGEPHLFFRDFMSLCEHNIVVEPHLGPWEIFLLRGLLFSRTRACVSLFRVDSRPSPLSGRSAIVWFQPLAQGRLGLSFAHSLGSVLGL